VWYKSITPVYQTGDPGALPGIRSKQGGDVMTLTVIVKNNNVEKAIRTLKKKVLKEGLLKEIKQRQYYEKPSLKRQRKMKENIKRAQKAKKMRERDL
tara:strand:- start:3570 stop:3860 length:291 start_codon:yes stop_codon:yes gene_type:complete